MLKEEDLLLSFWVTVATATGVGRKLLRHFCFGVTDGFAWPGCVTDPAGHCCGFQHVYMGSMVLVTKDILACLLCYSAIFGVQRLKEQCLMTRTWLGRGGEGVHPHHSQVLGKDRMGRCACAAEIRQADSVKRFLIFQFSYIKCV